MLSFIDAQEFGPSWRCVTYLSNLTTWILRTIKKTIKLKQKSQNVTKHLNSPPDVEETDKISANFSLQSDITCRNFIKVTLSDSTSDSHEQMPLLKGYVKYNSQQKWSTYKQHVIQSKQPVRYVQTGFIIILKLHLCSNHVPEPVGRPGSVSLLGQAFPALPAFRTCPALRWKRRRWWWWCSVPELGSWEPGNRTQVSVRSRWGVSTHPDRVPARLSRRKPQLQ